MKRRMFFLMGFIVALSIRQLHAQQLSNAEFKTYKDSVNTVIKDLRKQINEGDDALKKAEKLYEKSEQYIGLAERSDSYFLNLIAVILTLSGGLFAYLFNRAKNKLREDFNSYQDNLKKEIADKFKSEKELLERTLDKTSIEESIKKNKKILIISKKDDNNEPYENLTIKNGFAQVTVRSIKEDFSAIETEIKKYDLFILDNENGENYHWKLSDENLKNSLKGLLVQIRDNNKKFIYFGKDAPVSDGGLIKDAIFRNGNYTDSCTYVGRIADCILRIYK